MRYRLFSAIGRTNNALPQPAGWLGQRFGNDGITDDGELADGPFHLQLDETVQFNGILHREFLGDWLDEAIDDH